MKWVWIVMSLIALSTTACNSVGFDQKSSSSNASSPTPTATTTPTTNPSGVGGTIQQFNAPKYTISGPTCQANTQCLVQFKLLQPLSMTFALTWYTDDSKFGSAPPAGAPPYGQAGVDYISNENAPVTITFQPGQTEIDQYVRDINATGNAISIPIETIDCSVGGIVGNCQDYISQ